MVFKFGYQVTQLENQRSIHDAREAIQFLQQFLGAAEGKAAPAGKKVPTLGDFDFPLWNDQVIMRTLNMSSKTIYRRRKEGKFPYFRIGNLFYYWRGDILPFRDEYLK